MKTIAIEGIDGSGKTAQTTRLVEHLRRLGFPAISRDYPRYESFLGRTIGDMLRDGRASALDAYSMSLWYAADRYADYTQVVTQSGDDGQFVIFNRYSLSSAVYQSSRSKEPERVFRWVLDLEHTIFGLPRPHLYVVLDADIEETAKRNAAKSGREYIETGADVYEADTALQVHALTAYRQYALTEPKCVLIQPQTGGRMKSEQEIHDEIMKHVARTFAISL